MSERILVVDDDEVFLGVLKRAFERRGYEVIGARSAGEALTIAPAMLPLYVVLDLNLPGDSGLVLLRKLLERRDDLRILLLTGYASIATAVEAIKLGAVDYLPKPAEADAILKALFGTAPPQLEAPAQPLSVRRLEWEHLQRVLAEHGGNISAAARALGMHRRSLQRKLAKRPVRR